MVNHLRGPRARIGMLCAVFMALHAAAAPVSYKTGDKAQEDITAAVPFDVVDAQATAALKGSKARTIAAIYRRWDGITNTIANQFLKEFAEAHANFSNSITQSYQQPKIDNATIESSDFGYFLTAYNVQNKKFPVTIPLAVAWARGDSGAELRDKWLGCLLKTMSEAVEPDTLPPHFLYQKKIRIMPVTNASEEFTFNTAWHKGYVISADKVPAISVARAKFRKEFSANEQPLAAALAQLLQPNCLPEAGLTRDARDYSVRQLEAADHFDAGQVIVHRGATIDGAALAALEAMNEASAAAALSRQFAAAHEQARQQQAQLQSAAEVAQIEAQNEHTAAQLAQQQREQEQQERERAENLAGQARAQAQALHAQALKAQILAQKIQTRDEWIAGALVTVLVAVCLAWWRVSRRRQMHLISVPARLEKIGKYPAGIPAELAPILAQTLKEAVVQGLAAQRAELIEAQRMATVEIAQLADRLDQLHAPMQERLRAYQDRIQELQQDLAERTAENRELLKLKIEMMHRQIEIERARVNFN